MNKNNKLALYLSCLLFISSIGMADVLIDVTASMVDPACDIRGENQQSTLKIDFGTIELSSGAAHLAPPYAFPIYLVGCNATRSLSILLDSKNSDVLDHQGQKILSTSTEGLGVQIDDMTDGAIRILEMNKTTPIFPKPMGDASQRVDLQATLVNTIPINQLVAGKFTATLMMLVTYN